MILARKQLPTMHRILSTLVLSSLARRSLLSSIRVESGWTSKRLGTREVTAINPPSGALLVLPLTRPVFRGLLARVVASRLLVVPGGRFPGFPRDAGRPGPVVRGDVVDPDEGPQR